MEAEPPEGLLYGAKIKLQHVQTGRRLHSHGARYPGGSKQQQVTAFGGADGNDWWHPRSTKPDAASGVGVVPRRGRRAVAVFAAPSTSTGSRSVPPLL